MFNKLSERQSNIADGLFEQTDWTETNCQYIAKAIIDKHDPLTRIAKQMLSVLKNIKHHPQFKSFDKFTQDKVDTAIDEYKRINHTKINPDKISVGDIIEVNNLSGKNTYTVLSIENNASNYLIFNVNANIKDRQSFGQDEILNHWKLQT